LAAKFYEGMFVLESGRYGRDPVGVAGQIQQMIEQAGGKTRVSRLWEERRLAYPIKGHRKGTYWLTYFELEGSRLTEVRRTSQLNETILRSLFLEVDPRIVEALVAHALAGPTPPAEHREGPPVREERRPRVADVGEVAIPAEIEGLG
jgi:small subunit ribosomal protein S6